MMDLDEAIAHAREVAEGKHPNVDGCSECAVQHGQLADWLEELRWHRDLYKTDPGGILVFGERRKLADAFTVWAEQNGVAQIPESVIAYLLSEGLLNVKKCQHLISERGVKP